MDQALWTSEGLQSDSLSLENGAIMSNAARWSLIIDPQLQGRQWIVSKEAPNNLCILQQSQPKYVDKVQTCHGIHAISPEWYTFELMYSQFRQLGCLSQAQVSLMMQTSLQVITWGSSDVSCHSLQCVVSSRLVIVGRPQVLQCVQEGRPLLLENLPEDIDAVLDPVISKQVICRGKNMFLRIGDAEVEYNPNFRYIFTMPSHADASGAASN